MSEASISASPSNSDVTIYTARLKRRSKRSNINLPLQNNDQGANPDFFLNLLTDFYKDSEDDLTKSTATERKSKSVVKHPAIINNFKPFELEKSLVKADHIFLQESSKKNKANSFTVTQGFATCANLSPDKNIPQCCFINKTEKDEQNNSFIITESELISCCHQAEKILGNNSSKDQGSTPKKKDYTKLVNSILEDFSQSPLSKDQILTNVPCQCTPQFRLRRLPVKSYSRKHIKSIRINLDQHFKETEARLLSDHDEVISCCSSLSVQEDDTFSENPNNQTILATLNNTERLCENLVNLTEYFTQNELKQSFEESQEPDDKHSSEVSGNVVSNLNKISELCQDIITLRSKQCNELHNDSYDSMDDFNGFANSDHNQINHNFNVDVGCVRNSTNLKVIEDTTFVDDWNEDDYHDVFACINTENVLQQNNIHITNNERYNFDEFSSKYTNEEQNFKIPALNTAQDNHNTLKTDTLKALQVSEDADVVPAKILTNLSDQPDCRAKAPTSNCDNNILSKDASIFENPEDYEWNDDCDLFLNIHTPISFKENIVTTTQEATSRLPALSNFQQDVPSTSKLATLGFTTAAGKNVHVSRKGQATVQKLLNEFASEINSNTNYEEQLKEIKCKAYAKSHNLKAEATSVSIKAQGNKNQNLHSAQHDQFSMLTDCSSKNEQPKSQIQMSPCSTRETLNLKSIEMLNGTRNSASKFSKEFADIQNEKYLQCEMECIEHVVNTSKSLQKNVNAIQPLLSQKEMEHTDLGFQTANGKEISVSRKAKQILETLLKEFNEDVEIEKDLKDIKMNMQKKNKDLKPQPNHYTKNEEISAEERRNIPRNQLNTNLNKGFQTDNGKEISVSAKAKQTVENLLREVNGDLDIKSCEKDLKDLKTKLLNKNKSNEGSRKNLNEKSQLDEVSTKVEIRNINTNEVGFHTANGKQVHISASAKQAVVNLFQDLNTIADIETSEKYLNDAKTKIQNKNRDLQAKFFSQTPVSTTSTPNLSGEMTSKLTNCKRKMSIDNSDLETSNKTPAGKLFKTDLQYSKLLSGERTPLTSTSRLIRKNLSLTKKRKNKGNVLDKRTEEPSEMNKDLNDLNTDCTSTPPKSCIAIDTKEPAADTPNLKEFLTNAPSTSTPRINKPQSASPTFEDADLKPIVWKNDSSFCNKSENHSFYATKLSDTSTSNISFNSSNPTAKERIGRLKMYGKAPDVSPILIETNHKCRPSGLRRTRSMLKKSEN